MLKIAASVLAPSLAFLFHRSISSGIVPTEWKQAVVTPVSKWGKRQVVNNLLGAGPGFVLGGGAPLGNGVTDW